MDIRTRWNGWRVGEKLVWAQGAVLGAALLVSIPTAIVIAGWLTERQATADLQSKTRLLRDMVGVYNGSLERAADDLSNVFVSSFDSPVRLVPGQTVRIGSEDAPVLESGGRVLDLDFSGVDHFKRVTGSVA